MKIKDRIKEFRRVKASELAPNPKNWRVHPKAQKEALRGILADIGFAGAVLARETPEGLMLIDGHLRTETCPDSEIPCLILDVTEEEGNKILATFDPLSAMAKTDSEMLDNLLRNVQTDNQAVADMLTNLAEEAGIIEKEEKYSRKMEVPIYEPKNEKPNLNQLIDTEKHDKLVNEIESSNISSEIKEFLKKAASRHIVFNYELIADFYAHSSNEEKQLFENSALVIIDVNKAIENGLVKISEEISEIYGNENDE